MSFKILVALSSELPEKELEEFRTKYNLFFSPVENKYISGGLDFENVIYDMTGHSSGNEWGLASYRLYSADITKPDSIENKEWREEMIKDALKIKNLYLKTSNTLTAEDVIKAGDYEALEITG